MTYFSPDSSARRVPRNPTAPRSNRRQQSALGRRYPLGDTCHIVISNIIAGRSTRAHCRFAVESIVSNVIRMTPGTAHHLRIGEQNITNALPTSGMPPAGIAGETVS